MLNLCLKYMHQYYRSSIHASYKKLLHDATRVVAWRFTIKESSLSTSQTSRLSSRRFFWNTGHGTAKFGKCLQHVKPVICGSQQVSEPPRSTSASCQFHPMVRPLFVCNKEVSHTVYLGRRWGFPRLRPGQGFQRFRTWFKQPKFAKYHVQIAVMQ